MKVLFLDIDGVLNRHGTRERCEGFIGADRDLCAKLTDWLKDKDIKIVLSSTWRLHPEMHQHLHDAGIHWIDVTPDLANKRENGVWTAKVRGDEIQHWLDQHPEVTAYAILDDDSDMLKHQRRYFVQTSNPKGLEDKHLRRLSEIFNV